MSTAQTPEAARLVIRPFSEADEPALIEVWRRCNLVVPWNVPHDDVQRKLQVQRDLYLVAVLDGRIAGTVMAGYDGHRGWINYLAVDPDCQRQGLGRQLMAAAEAGLRALGCPKINLQVRRANANVVGFYERIGFVVEDRISMAKRL